MAYQSEAALEQQFIEQLNKQEYTTVAIPDYDALVENFKVQFEAFNAPKLDTPITDKEWERIFNLMLGKSVFQSAKILRDKFVLEREDGTKVYLSFGNVKKCAVGKHPKSEKLGSTGQAACCARIHSRYFTGGSPSGLRV